eukprot:TRINITY_DN1243_c0_g1_i2.p2 TRINITY_DN1243_c0_g1~~TRINITY_DN1243_c0_g1_i2.p2  ORF type:complete len:180 (+),score=35.07 TRINITY_DN1243_c0_g1_i2:151-690(+)
MKNRFTSETFDFEEYAMPTNTCLPYNWDGECHLILNSSFYSHSRGVSDEKGRCLDSLDLDIEFEPFEPADNRNLSDSQSIETMGSEAMMGAEVAEDREIGRCRTLDSQLEFIMGKCKRSYKNEYRDGKPKRSRKTQEQLDILSEEFQRDRKFNKTRIRVLAKKTGLSEVQVYKWFWDHT